MSEAALCQIWTQYVAVSLLTFDRTSTWTRKKFRLKARAYIAIARVTFTYKETINSDERATTANYQKRTILIVYCAECE